MSEVKITDMNLDAAPSRTDRVESAKDPAGTPLPVAVELGAIADLANPGNIGALAKALFEANTIAKADTAGTPVALQVAEQTLLGRITAGVIAALTPAQVRTLLNVEDGAAANMSGAEIKAAYEAEANTNAFTDAAAANLAALVAGAILNTAFNAHTILAADAADAPAPVAIAEQRLVGRIAGGVIAALTGAQARTIVAAQVDTVAKLASFTFALNEAGLWTTIDNAGATAATIPPNSSVSLPVNSILTLEQIGAGACTWSPGAGVTINVHSGKTLVTNGPRAVSFARQVAADEWNVYGDLAAA